MLDDMPSIVDPDTAHQLARAFCAGMPYQSAMPDELELAGIGYRRPLRPEDLDFLHFRSALSIDTLHSLTSLASGRILRCLYDQARTQPGATDYSQLRDFLDVYSLGWLRDADRSAMTANIGSDGRSLLDWLAASPGDRDEWRRMVLVQLECILSAIQSVPLGDGASGTVRMPDAFKRWVQQVSLSLRERGGQLGLKAGGDVYWQFMLPATLAIANFVSGVAAPNGDSRGQAAILQRVAKYLDVMVRWVCDDGAIDDLPSDLPDGADAIASTDMDRAAALLDVFDQELRQHLAWLSDLDRNPLFARQLCRRIERDCPDIDRETFVEPNDMCSTTHIHDDHRLVIIEDGDMTFWASPKLRITMGKGDALFVPQGRLHGSTVTSPQCTYHQPILPIHWVEPYLAACEGRPLLAVSA